MTVVFSKKPHDRFTPDSYKVDGEVPPAAPVYILAALSMRERAQYYGAIALAGLRYPQDAELFRVLREAVEEVAPDNADALIADIQAFQDVLDGPDAPAAPADGVEETDAARMDREAEIARRTAVSKAYETLIDLMRAHPAVAHVVSLRTIFLETAPLLASAAALRGWENVIVPFRRVAGVVPDEVLELLPEEDVRAIGARAMQLISVTREQRKN